MKSEKKKNLEGIWCINFYCECWDTAEVHIVTNRIYLVNCKENFKPLFLLISTAIILFAILKYKYAFLSPIN